MERGPFEYVVIDFPGSTMPPAVAPALSRLIATGTIRIIDMAFIRKDANGHVDPLELNQLDPAAALPYEELDGEIDDLISADDIQTTGADLPPDSIALMLVCEDVWVAEFADAVRSAHGQMLANESVPRPVVETAMKAAAPTLWQGGESADGQSTQGSDDYAATSHGQ